MNTDAFSYRPIEFCSRGTEYTVLQCAWRVESLNYFEMYLLYR